MSKPALHPSVMQKMAEGISPQSASQTSVDVGTILKNLDGQFINKYVLHLEGGRAILKSYLDELSAIENRLSKASLGVRKALGEDELIEKKFALEETLNKLTAHQTKSIERLRNG